MESKSFTRLRMYATSWCGDCALARRFLHSRGISCEEVDVDEVEEADARVLAHNRGTRHLPVFEFGDEMRTVSPFDRRVLAAWLLEVGAAAGSQVSDAARTDPDP